MNGKNILLILTDQQRADTLSGYDPDGLCRTPHLDRFAEDAIVFDNGYTNCAVCSPARASLMTGLQPSHHGIQTNTRGYGCRVHDLPDTPELLSRRLASAGYRCGYTGKWHLGFDRTEPGSDTAPFPAWYFTEGNALPTTRGFIGDDFPGHGGGGYEYPLFQEYLRSNGLEFVVEHEYQEHTHPNHTCWGEVTSPVESTNEFFLVDRTIHYLERLRSVDQPFYFQLNLWGPHAPFYAPTRHLDPYRDMAIPPWPNFADPLAGKPGIHDVWRRFDKPWEFFATALKHYYGFMSSIDEQIGRLLAYLGETGLYDETTIIFVADHGDSHGCHAGLENKALHMYEEIMKIPYLIKPAGTTGGGRRRQLVSLYDLYATVLEVAGVSRPIAERDGRSLVPVIESPDAPWRDYVLAEGSGTGQDVILDQRMLRFDDSKYVFNAGMQDELYDLAADPHELSNLAPRPEDARRVRHVRERMYAAMLDMGDPIAPVFRHLMLRGASAAAGVS